MVSGVSVAGRCFQLFFMDPHILSQLEGICKKKVKGLPRHKHKTHAQRALGKNVSLNLVYSNMDKIDFPV